MDIRLRKTANPTVWAIVGATAITDALEDRLFALTKRVQPGKYIMHPLAYSVRPNKRGQLYVRFRKINPRASLTREAAKLINHAQE